jgi:hypothetical protein
MIINDPSVRKIHFFPGSDSLHQAAMQQALSSAGFDVQAGTEQTQTRFRSVPCF